MIAYRNDLQEDRLTLQSLSPTHDMSVKQKDKEDERIRALMLEFRLHYFSSTLLCAGIQGLLMALIMRQMFMN